MLLFFREDLYKGKAVVDIVVMNDIKNSIILDEESMKESAFIKES